MRSHPYDHGRLMRGGVGTSTPARKVTGVRGFSPPVVNSTVLPSTVRSAQAVPTPKPTEHCAPVTSAGRVARTCTRWITLFQDGAITFQKNADVELGSPLVVANCRFSPVVPGSSTPGMA